MLSGWFAILPNALADIRQRGRAILDPERLPCERDRQVRRVTKHAVATDGISRRFQSKDEEFAGLNGAKCKVACRLPKVDFIDAGLGREKVEPVWISVGYPKPNQEAPPSPRKKIVLFE